MFPEVLSQSVIKPLADIFDPGRKGTAIEIGVGTSNYYSLKFKNEGLRCIAVDPIAYPPFVALADENDILFEEACIYDRDGEITLFGSHYSDLSSVNQDWWGVDPQNQKKVKAILLGTLLDNYNVEQITFLKADTEGSEYEIIKQFKDLAPARLPMVVEFEYGGGAFKHTGEGGWNKRFFDKVIAIIHTLKELDYEQGLIIDSNDAMPVFVDLAKVDSPDELFKPHYEYGNFMVFKTAVNNTAELENILLKAQTRELETLIAALHASNATLNARILKTRYLARFANKIKRIFKKKQLGN